MEDLGAIITLTNKSYQLYLEGRQIKVLHAHGSTLAGVIDADSLEGQVILGLGAPAYATECFYCGDWAHRMSCFDCIREEGWRKD